MYLGRESAPRGDLWCVRMAAAIGEDGISYGAMAEEKQKSVWRTSSTERLQARMENDRDRGEGAFGI